MADPERYTIDDLVDLTGLSRRTIRFYVEKGLIQAPAGRGRGGFYDAATLERLRDIVAAREEGRSLASIAASPDSGTQGRERSEAEGFPRFEGHYEKFRLADGLAIEVARELSEESRALLAAILDLARKGSA